MFVASQEDMAVQKAAGRWLEGLLSGDEVVTHEVFSYSGDVYLDHCLSGSNGKTQT
jgi:hypothetical protein